MFCRGHRPVLDTCANEAIPRQGMGGLINHLYLQARPAQSTLNCGAKLKLALVVVTIVNVDGGIYRVIRGHFGSRVTPENFKGGSQRQVGVHGPGGRL